MHSEKPQNSFERLIDSILKIGPAFLALLALWLAMAGQNLFHPEDPTSWRSGMLRFLLATFCLLLARVFYRSSSLSLRQTLGRQEGLELTKPSDLLIQVRQLSSWRLLATLLAILIIVSVLVGLAGIDINNPPASITAYFWGWVVASALVAGAWLTPLPNWREGQARVVAWLRDHRWEVLGLAVITLLGAWLRLANLGSAPFTISGDEGSIGLEVQRVLRGDLRHPFALMWGSHGSLMAFILALPVRLFGYSIGSLRLVGALMGTLAIPALFALAWQVGGKRVGLIAALLLATFPMHLHFSRAQLIIVWDAFTYPATLAAFWWGMRRDQHAIWPFALAALVGGIGQYPYTGSRLLPLLLSLFLLYLALFDQERLRSKRHGLLVMGLIFAIVASPHYLFGLQYPNEFNARLNQEGILQNGWLAQEITNRNESVLLILWDQFRRALFGFAFFPDRSAAWNPGTPLAPPLLSLGFFFGLLLSLRDWRHPAIILLHGWLWCVILIGGMLTLNPPSSNRLIAATPVVCIFAAFGWHRMARALTPLFSLKAPHTKATTLILLTLLTGFTALSGIRAHRNDLADNHFDAGNAFLATKIGYQLAARPAETTLIMAGAPRLYSDISPLLFLTPNYARQDIYEPLTAPPTNLPANADLMFVVLPERASDLLFIQQAFPNGQLEEIRAENRDELLYYQMIVQR